MVDNRKNEKKNTRVLDGAKERKKQRAKALARCLSPLKKKFSCQMCSSSSEEEECLSSEKGVEKEQEPVHVELSDCRVTLENLDAIKLDGLVDVEIQVDGNLCGRSNRGFIQNHCGTTHVDVSSGKDSGDKQAAHTGLSVSDVTIRHCNNLILKKMSTKAAKTTWEIGKRTGVTYNGDEEEILDKIKGMEDRDRDGINLNGEQQGFP